jgi:type 1 glutamine amidotransferase
MLTIALALTALVPANAGQPPEPIPVLIVSGASNHDWRWTSPELETLLEASGLFAADITNDPAKTLADPKAIARYKAFVLDYNGERWGAAAEAAFLAAVEGGAGVSVIHAANNAFEGWKEYERLVGYLWRNGTGHGQFHAFDVTLLDREHPITRGMFDLRAHPDELYHKLWKAPDTDHRVLATAWSSSESGGTGAAEPMITVGSYGKGRVFHTPLGHVWEKSEATRASYADPQFRELVVRGTEWAATGACSGASATHNQLSSAEREQGWKLLFDGSTPAGWLGFRSKEFPRESWKIEQGLLLAPANAEVDLASEREYGNFDLEFEWRVDPKANSGVIYRVSDEGEATWVSGPEYQVIDDAYFGSEAPPLQCAGALYGVAEPGQRSLRPVGEFNRGRIVVDGWRVEHWLNGELLLACDLASDEGRARIQKSKFGEQRLFARAERGRICLQGHGGSVAYRNVKLRERSANGAAGERIALFNGRDLAGWKFFLADGSDPKAVWSVAPDGVLVCKGTPAGYIQTEAEYESFVLELDWRWDPAVTEGRNSGVLLRKIGDDKIWPKSLEAQLMDGNAGDFWLIEGFPAKTVAERTNGRNAKKTHANEKPAGEWNRYRITVDGGDVTLEVNGQVLNQASEVLVVPGRIALQSEGAPIQFREIHLTPLE